MSLLVWLPLIADSENYGASPLQAQLPTCATLDTTGKIGKCYTSDGSAVGAISTFNYTFSQFTIAAWIRINTRVNSWRCTVKMANSGGDKDYIGFGCQNTNGTTLGFHFYKTISGTNTKIFDKYALTPTNGEWMHLAVTYDGQTATYYKNGVELSHDAIATAVQNTNAVINQLILLGSDGSRSAAAVKDSLNDLRIYSHCLSAAEVHEISQGLILHYKLDDLTRGIQDSSGYNHNGTITGTLTSNASTARYTASTYISSGDTNYITSPTLQLPGDKITMNFWFKSSNTSPGSSYHMPFEGTANSNQSYEMSIHSSGYLRGGLIVAGSRKVDNCTSKVLLNGNWHMCSMTYDGATIKRYVDGVMEKSTSVTGALATSTAFVLGHYGSNTSYCAKEVYISDVRLYVTALSEVDIKQLYEMGAKVDNKGSLHTYELKEEGTIPKIYKKGIVSHNRLRESALINTVSSFSYKPAANANNSTTVGTYIDLSEFANDGKPLTLTLEYDVNWSNFAAGTGGTFSVYLQGARRKKETNTDVWEGDALLTTDGTFTSLITANATGTYHKSRTFTIPATWFNTYCGQNFGIRTNYSNGNGTITISNLKLTIPVNSFKLKSKSIQANNFIEL